MPPSIAEICGRSVSRGRTAIVCLNDCPFDDAISTTNTEDYLPIATGFTHAFVAVAFAKATFPRKMPWTFFPVAMACSALPDLDVALHAYGVKYGDPWGHRGMTHSLAFAALLSLTVVPCLFRKHARRFNRRWWALVTFFFLITASHGFLDAFTDGGRGIAFFAPFNNTRYFMPWRPLYVSPIGLHDVFTPHLVRAIRSELLLVWLPTLAITSPIILWRLRRRDQAPSTTGDS